MKQISGCCRSFLCLSQPVAGRSSLSQPVAGRSSLSQPVAGRSSVLASLLQVVPLS